MPTKEESSSISTVGDLTSNLSTHEPTADGEPTSGGKPTADIEPSGSGDGTTPPSGTTGEYGVMTVNSYIEGEVTEWNVSFTLQY